MEISNSSQIQDNNELNENLIEVEEKEEIKEKNLNKTKSNQENSINNINEDNISNEITLLQFEVQKIINKTYFKDINNQIEYLNIEKEFNFKQNEENRIKRSINFNSTNNLKTLPTSVFIYHRIFNILIQKFSYIGRFQGIDIFEFKFKNSSLLINKIETFGTIIEIDRQAKGIKIKVDDSTNYLRAFFFYDRFPMNYLNELKLGETICLLGNLNWFIPLDYHINSNNNNNNNEFITLSVLKFAIIKDPNFEIEFGLNVHEWLKKI